MKWLSVKEQSFCCTGRMLFLTVHCVERVSSCVSHAAACHYVPWWGKYLLLLEKTKDVPVVVWATVGVGCGLISNTSHSLVSVDITKYYALVYKAKLKRNRSTANPGIHSLTQIGASLSPRGGLVLMPHNRNCFGPKAVANAGEPWSSSHGRHRPETESCCSS